MKIKFIALAISLTPCFALAQGPAETDAQKLTKSISTLQRMIELVRLQKPAGRAPHRPQTTRKMLWAFGNDQAPAPLPADVEARAQKMQAMTQVGGCELILPTEQSLHIGQDQMQAGVTAFHAELGGKDCPVAMSINLKAQQVGDRIDASFDLSFRALTPEFQAEADLIEVHQSGLIQMEITTNGGQRLFVNAEITGGGNSKTLGTFDSKQVFGVDFSFTPPLSLKMKTNTEHSFTLNNNSLVLKTETSMDGIFSSSEKFYFNGQDITKDVYEALAQGIHFIGIDEKKSDAVPPLTCQLRVLDKKQVVLHVVSACQKDIAQEWNYQGKKFTSSITFKKNWVESTFAPSGAAGQTIYSLYEEVGVFQKAIGDFIVQSECKPATCP